MNCKRLLFHGAQSLTLAPRAGRCEAGILVYNDVRLDAEAPLAALLCPMDFWIAPVFLGLG